MINILVYHKKDIIQNYISTPKVYDPGRPSVIGTKLFDIADHIIAPDYPEYISISNKYYPDKKLMAISKGGQNIELFGDEMDHILIEKVKVVDTMGAGDILHGAYSFGIANGLKPKDSLIQASKIATKSTTHWGARI